MVKPKTMEMPGKIAEEMAGKMVEAVGGITTMVFGMEIMATEIQIKLDGTMAAMQMGERVKAMPTSHCAAGATNMVMKLSVVSLTCPIQKISRLQAGLPLSVLLVQIVLARGGERAKA